MATGLNSEKYLISTLLRMTGFLYFTFALAGCGGSGSSSNTTSAANTAVTLLATSTANDKVSAIPISMSSLTLTSESGTTVTLFSTEEGEEFIHVNGPMEPLLTASIPAGTYTQAALTVSGGDALCAGTSSLPATLVANVFAEIEGPPPVMVNLPQPIVISGSSAVLTLNLQVSQSLQPFSLCSAGITNQIHGLTPAFTLTSAGAMQSGVTALQGLKGIIQSANGSGFQVAGNQLPTIGEPGPAWQVSTSNSTVFQGVSGPTALAAGMAVELDASISSNGALDATRVAVYDTSTTNTALALGPVLDPQSTVMISPAIETEVAPVIPEFATYAYSGGTMFNISSQLANVAQLPFHATFSAANLVGGQNVMAIAHLSSLAPGPRYTPVSTMVLIPQTVDGVVTAMGTEGAFTTYTITLAPYDLFPNLATLAGSGSSALQAPNTIVVYADGSAQMQTSAAVGVGSTYRFNGLVFNDNGTLRMDCDAVYDGVAQ